MPTISLMANSGIQMFTFPLEILDNDAFSMLFYESYDKEEGFYKLDLIYELSDENDAHFYRKKELYDGGYLAGQVELLTHDEIKADGEVKELEYDDEERISGIFKMNFAANDSKVNSLLGSWLPLPYFHLRSNGRRKRFDQAPLNWARFKILPSGVNEKGKKIYNVLLAFDTRCKNGEDRYSECPVFADYNTELEYELCSDEYALMDYCSCNNERTSQFVDTYIRELVHPGVGSVGKIRGEKHKLSYLASYVHLINWLATKGIFPKVTLYRSDNVEAKNMDLIIDIGNSRTTALVVEDHADFNQVRQLSLIDYSNPVITGREPKIRQYNEPFDMRLAFRKADFGNCGNVDSSKQFVYPSLIRLGKEANNLIHKASADTFDANTRSTYSSPKRYLWDKKMSDKEWEFLVLEGEADNHILNLPGITNQFKDDGSFDKDGIGGSTHRYSRSTLMTLAFLEMIAQANVQVNSSEYRRYRGNEMMPRLIRRIIVTCPTTMSKLERESLVNSLKSAIKVYCNFYRSSEGSPEPLVTDKVQVIPSYSKSLQDDKPAWYYDEASCSQLVYMYSEVAHKYKGNCEEFFSLYGKKGEEGSTLTVGSVDIGAGTSDLMICKYNYTRGLAGTTLKPEPLFFDSFYTAGDDILHELVRLVMFDGQDTAIYCRLKDRGVAEPRQIIKNFFGHSHNEESMRSRVLKRDFNLQVSVPLMSWWLQQLAEKSEDRVVTYDEVFKGNEPSKHVLDHFEQHFGFDFRSIEWKFEAKKADAIVTAAIEPLLKQISAIMYAYSCDIIVLSGRPASIPAVGNIFLKYYAVSPNRLVVLNEFNVGDWYPFSQNTDYIKNAKTVVAVGAMIAHYASELSLYDNFVLDTTLLGEKLKPTVNFVRQPKGNFCLTETANTGDIQVTAIPSYLNIKQVESPSYPERTLYKIDYNRAKIYARMMGKTDASGDFVMESYVPQLVQEEFDRLRKLSPFKIQISRDPEDIENIIIEGVTDKFGNDINTNNFEIYIESLGADDSHWLDTGTFEF